MDNQVCSLFSSNKQRVILFIIDGLGMGQYLWSQNVVPSNKNFIYSENIFNWLAKEKHSNEYILGAPLITDTAAGMCQLFTGKTSKETRVFSSTVKRSGDPRVIGVKSESPNSFAEIADTNNFIDYSWGEIEFEYSPMRGDMLCKSAMLEEDCGSFAMDIEPDDIDVSDTVTVVWEIA